MKRAKKGFASGCGDTAPLYPPDRKRLSRGVRPPGSMPAASLLNAMKYINQ
jgi:hypothetical protein